MISACTETEIVINLHKKLLFYPVKSWAVGDIRLEWISGILKFVSVSSSEMHDSLITQADFIAFTCCESLKSSLLRQFVSKMIDYTEVNHIDCELKMSPGTKNIYILL
jgi:hypothetical protein